MRPIGQEVSAHDTTPSSRSPQSSCSHLQQRPTEIDRRDPNKEAKALLLIGRTHAFHCGLNRDDAEDCAVEFAMLELCRTRQDQENGAMVLVSPPESLRALHRRAHQHAHNHSRVLARHYRRVIICLERIDEEGNRDPMEVSDGRDARHDLLRKEVRKAIETALSEIAVEPRALFVAHVMEDIPLADLAAQQARSTEGVKKCLKGVRERLRAILARRDWSEAELRAFLQAPMNRVPG